jgi:hypothetical protein
MAAIPRYCFFAPACGTPDVKKYDTLHFPRHEKAKKTDSLYEGRLDAPAYPDSPPRSARRASRPACRSYPYGKHPRRANPFPPPPPSAAQLQTWAAESFHGRGSFTWWGLADAARHVIQRILSPRVFNCMACYDAVRTTGQAPPPGARGRVPVEMVESSSTSVTRRGWGRMRRRRSTWRWRGCCRAPTPLPRPRSGATARCYSAGRFRH